MPRKKFSDYKIIRIELDNPALTNQFIQDNLDITVPLNVIDFYKQMVEHDEDDCEIISRNHNLMINQDLTIYVVNTAKKIEQDFYNDDYINE